MHIGRILLGWLVIGAVVVMALMASGIVSVHIEITTDDEDDKKRKKLKDGLSSPKDAEAAEGDDSEKEDEEK